MLRYRPLFQPHSVAAACSFMGGAARLPYFCPHYALLDPRLNFLDGIARVPHSRILPDRDQVYKKIGLMQRFPLFKIYSRPPAEQKRGLSLHPGSQSGQWKNASSRGSNAFLDAKRLVGAPRMAHRQQSSEVRQPSSVGDFCFMELSNKLNSFWNFSAVPTRGTHTGSTLLADRFASCLHGSTARAFKNTMFLYSVCASTFVSTWAIKSDNSHLFSLQLSGGETKIT